MINVFLSSTEFQKIQAQVNTYGQIDNNLSRVTYVDGNTNKPILNIAITQSNVVKAVLESVPVPSSLTNVLPNNEHYVMQLVDYSNYDINTKTGVIKTIDLNYDSYLSSQLIVSNSSVTDFTAYPVPPKVRAKYSGLKTIAEI